MSEHEMVTVTYPPSATFYAANPGDYSYACICGYGGDRFHNPQRVRRLIEIHIEVCCG